MKETEFIWCQSPEICAAIITVACTLITAVGAGLFYWRKNKILSDFQKEIDDHKEELIRTTNEQQENLTRTTNALQEKMRIEYGVVYSRRLQVIEEVHEHLLYLKKATKIANKKLLNFKRVLDEDEKEVWDNIQVKQKEFYKFFDKSQLYLSKDLVKFIKNTYDVMWASPLSNVPNIYLKLAALEYKKSKGLDDSEIKKFDKDLSAVMAIIKKMENSGCDFEKQFDWALERLQDEFRSLIGVKNKS